MTKHNLKCSAILLSAMTTMVALPGQSIGADSKVIGPTVCRKAITSNTLGLEYNSDAVINVSGGAAQVQCNLSRDNTGNTNGLSDLEISVTDSASGGVICDALSVDRNGNLLRVTRKSSTKTGPQVLDFGGALNVSSNKGSYLVTCFLTNGSKIHSIYLNEF